MHKKTFAFVALMAISNSPPASAGGGLPCLSCGGVLQSKPTTTPLRIEIESMLDFSKVAILPGQSGAVMVDPVAGSKQVSGGALDMGGMTLKGTAQLYGEPNALVRVDLPARVQLRSSTGEAVDVVDLKTNLSPAARLDGAGRLTVSFGGRLLIKSSATGQLRGSIPITADYQ